MLTQNRNLSLRAVGRSVLAFACAGIASSAQAADGTWNGAAGGAFSDGANWAGGIVPGVADGTFTSTDTATFNGGPPADLSTNPLPVALITVDANRNLANIRFDNTNTYPITLQGGPLLLTGGGTTEITTNAINNATTTAGMTHTITAPMVVHGNSYTFRNSVLATNVGLRPQGDITFNAAGLSTLFLDGVNAQAINNGPTQVWSVLTDAPGGTTSVVKNGTGTWELRPDGNITGARPNTYSGDTVVNAGILRLSGLGAGSVNSTIIINSGGRLQLSANNQTIGKVVLKSGGTLASSNASTNTNLFSNSGPALLLDYETTLVSPSLPLGFTGTVAGEGGVKLDNRGQALLAVTLGNTTTPYNLGTVARPFDIPLGETTNSYDFRLRGFISGTGGLLKVGSGRMRLEPNVTGAGSILTGTIEVREGTLDFAASNGFINKPALLVSGGRVNIAGDQTQTLGAITVTKGSITGSNSISTLIGSSVTLNPATGDTADITVKIGDDAALTSVVKNGAGTSALGGANTYTGGTTINAGTLIVDGDANDTIIGGPNVTVVGGADIRGGRLVFDYTGGASPATQVVGALTTGFASNFATGEIRSSTATSARGLGYLDDGVAAFTVAAALYGDTDLSGTVNFDDLLKLAQSYGATSGADWSGGDVNYDGAVDFDDLLKLAQNYGASALAGGAIVVDADLASAFDAHWALAQSMVPEPATLGVLAGAVVTGLRRRR